MALQIEVDFKELIQWNQELKEEPKKEEETIQKYLVQIRDEFYRSVRKITPVDTGNLKSNWKKETIKQRTNGKSQIIETSVYNLTEYGPYVNYGHFSRGGRYVPGQYFVELALYTMKDIHYYSIRGNR